MCLFEKVGTRVLSEAGASPEVEKEAAINSLIRRNRVCEFMESDLSFTSINNNC